MKKCPPTVPPSAAQTHEAMGPPALGRRSAPRCAAVPAPAAGPQATVLAARRLVPHPRPPRRPSQSTGHQPPGGEHLPERSRVVRLALPSLSWPSSVPVGRCGVGTRPGLLPPSAAHVATMSADGAAFAALRHHRHQPDEVIHYSNSQKMVPRKPV